MPVMRVKYKKGKLGNLIIGVFTLVTLLVTTTTSEAVTSTCGIPSVPEGQQTTLTCHFSEDLSQLNRKFKVVHYFAESDKPENVLLCYWSSGIAHCQAHRDYTVVGNVTDKVTLKVQRASSSHTGRYLCHAFQSTPESDESCNFSLKKVKSSCDIPAVVEGGNATLSCSFGDDISKLQMRVKVVHYIKDRPENVLLCAWAGEKPTCQAKVGYTFRGKVTDTLLLEIPFVSLTHAGAYRCQLYQSANEIGELCHFSVKEKSSSIMALDFKDLLSPILLVLSIVVGTAVLWTEHHNLKKPKYQQECQQDDLKMTTKSPHDASELETSPTFIDQKARHNEAQESKLLEDDTNITVTMAINLTHRTVNGIQRALSAELKVH